MPCSQAYVHGIPKSQVSWICGELDGELTAFKERPLDHTVFPYVFLDATYCKARMDHRIVSHTVVIDAGIFAAPRDPGAEVGDSESKPFWTKFLRYLRAHGLKNVQLVISDSHSGLVAAIRTVLARTDHRQSRPRPGPTSSRSSPTPQHSTGSPPRSSPNSTTSGRSSTVATSPEVPWPSFLTPDRQETTAGFLQRSRINSNSDYTTWRDTTALGPVTPADPSFGSGPKG
ncbi:hypothetical protein GCM10010339_89010 [Streptomyces alanosinicus]|uniref:Mutator family transposase n=1 Tax=Streptomyces alanosinicus TaxID=68171 RepID=A0A918YST9_9ACTN|nr:hypothetical protein GCM10010339_89010 [Streptomyces alanosinicus]